MIVNAPTLFAVVSPGENVALGTRISSIFPEDHLKVNDHHWLIVASGVTAQEVSTKIGITDATVGSGMVYATAGYWGRANPQVWEWIRVKMSASPNA